MRPVSNAWQGAALREWRLAMGWTQRQAAAALQVSEPWVCRAEAGRAPIPDNLRLIALAMRVVPVLNLGGEVGSALMALVQERVVAAQAAFNGKAPCRRHWRKARKEAA